VDRAIIDKHVTVEADAKVGWSEKNTPNRERPDRLNTGLTVVGKGAVIPQGMRVGRNVVIHPRVTAESYNRKEVPSGATIYA